MPSKRPSFAVSERESICARARETVFLAYYWWNSAPGQSEVDPRGAAQRGRTRGSRCSGLRLDHIG